MPPVTHPWHESVPIWLQHIFTAGVVLVGLIVAWVELSAQVDDNQDDIGDNKSAIIDNRSAIEDLGEQLHSIQRKQDVLESNQNHEIERQNEFRTDTKDQLREIIQELRQVPPRRPTLEER